MEYPKNCNECSCAMGCQTYYGGSLCRHTKEINRAAVEAVLKEEKPK